MELKHFKYTATTPAGKTIKGRMEALNKDVCKRFLHTKNYKVKDIHTYSNPFAKLSNITIGSLLKKQDLVFFLKQLSSLLSSGVNILSALELLALQNESRHLRKLYFELYQQVYNGFSFSKALQSKPKEFPKLLVQMVEMGELSGQLPKMVKDMADYYDKQIKIAAGIKGAVRMPIIYLIAALLIAAGMLVFVFPNISTLFSSFEDAEMPPITRFFINAGDFTATYAVWIFGGLALIVGAIYAAYKLSEDVRYAMNVLWLKIPIMGSLIQMHNQIMIANAFAQMLSNGVNPLVALKTTRAFLKNPVYASIIEETIENIQEGLPFSKAFEESSYIDPIMAKMISTGEKTSDIPDLMENLALYYDGITDLRIEKIKNALQPALLIIVYAIVGVMILAIMLPMISLGGQI